MIKDKLLHSVDFNSAPDGLDCGITIVRSSILTDSALSPQFMSCPRTGGDLSGKQPKNVIDYRSENDSVQLDDKVHAIAR
jgi:hypothetical protein